MSRDFLASTGPEKEESGSNADKPAAVASLWRALSPRSWFTIEHGRDVGLRRAQSSRFAESGAHPYRVAVRWAKMAVPRSFVRMQVVSARSLGEFVD
jgi:hypothetical protein